MKGSFKIYQITNRITGDKITIGAESTQEACEKPGWRIKDCSVSMLCNPDTAVPTIYHGMN